VPKTASKLAKKKAKRSATKPSHPGAETASATAPLNPQQALELQRDQMLQHQQLLEKLASLKREIAMGEANRSEAADALADSEKAISDVNRHLHDLEARRSTVKAQLDDINQHRATIDQSIAGQQAQLAQMLHDQYLSGVQDPYKLLFSGDDPNRIQRDRQYLGYVSEAEATVLRSLRDNLTQLASLSTQAQAQNAQLGEIADQQQAQRDDLMKDEQARRTTLAQISEKLQQQRAQAGAMARDEKRLSDVVLKLGQLIERQEKEAKERERARAAEQARQAEQARKEGAVANPERRETRKTPAPSPERPESIAEPHFAGNFLALRGKLHLPVEGELAGRFGTSRAEGGPSWKGLFIRAAAGTPVRAIAPGRVVFAEWLRGFGNLLILDHGNQYLSIYGNNEALLKQPGDVVQSGEVIATVGNSGGNPQTGLYFEMRYQGKPFDPLGWTTSR